LELLGALEIVILVVILGVLLLLQTRTRAGPLVLYATIGALVLMLILALRVIRSLVGMLIVLVFVCIILLWRVLRSR